MSLASSPPCPERLTRLSSAPRPGKPGAAPPPGRGRGLVPRPAPRGSAAGTATARALRQHRQTQTRGPAACWSHRPPHPRPEELDSRRRGQPGLPAQTRSRGASKPPLLDGRRLPPRHNRPAAPPGRAACRRRWLHLPGRAAGGATAAPLLPPPPGPAPPPPPAAAPARPPPPRPPCPARAAPCRARLPPHGSSSFAAACRCCALTLRARETPAAAAAAASLDLGSAPGAQHRPAASAAPRPGLERENGARFSPGSDVGAHLHARQSTNGERLGPALPLAARRSGAGRGRGEAGGVALVPTWALAPAPPSPSRPRPAPGTVTSPAGGGACGTTHHVRPPCDPQQCALIGRMVSRGTAHLHQPIG